MLNVVFVTLLYGPGLPILYIIAALYYFMFWNIQRYSIVYLFQNPPSMDYTLTKNTI